MEHDITSYSHGIGKIAVNLVQDVLRWPSQQYGACFWISTLGEEGKVLIANLLDFEKTALRSNI
jgi:hypothetical protein